MNSFSYKCFDIFTEKYQKHWSFVQPNAPLVTSFFVQFYTFSSLNIRWVKNWFCRTSVLQLRGKLSLDKNRGFESLQSLCIWNGNQRSSSWDNKTRHHRSSGVWSTKGGYRSALNQVKKWIRHMGYTFMLTADDEIYLRQVSVQPLRGFYHLDESKHRQQARDTVKV